MKYITELLIVLVGVFFTLNEAHYVEMPSDMRYPVCQSDDMYQVQIDEPYLSDDYRMKRQQKQSLGERIENLKMTCSAELGIPKEEVPEDMLNVPEASRKIKCLMTCILQRLQLMTSNNLVSIIGIEQVADEVGNYNPLVTSLAIALAEKYNERLSSLKITDQCEAGYLINRYISKEMKNRKVDIPY